MKSKSLTALFMAISTLSFAQDQAAKPSSPQPTTPNKNLSAIVAKIGTKSITLGEFESRYEQNTRLNPGAKPSRQEVLKNIVYFELATQEARKQKINLDKVVQDQFDILLYQELVRRNIQPKIDAYKVSEAEVKKFYESSPLIKTRHIVLLTRPEMSAEEKEKVKSRAQSLLPKLRDEKKDFAEVAREYSEGPSAKTGGDVDWGAKHKLLGEYYDAAIALKTPGNISDVVESPYGFHIIQLNGIKEYSKIDPVYKDYIVRSIKEQKGQKIYDDYFESLKTQNKVVTNENLL
jgi:parvulin-like peptidyl-prolyl isomerase